MTESSKPPVFTEPYRRELFERRILVLDGPLDDDNGVLLATQIFALATADSEADISLWIHSPGGSVPAMLAIRDMIRLVPNDVSTLALGIAYSAGQFLLTAGTSGKRLVLPHTRVLMHQGSAGIGGSTGDVELQAADLRHTRDTVLGLTSEDTGQPVAKVFEDSLHDHWYAAEEAIAYGFADSIVGSFATLLPARVGRRVRRFPAARRHTVSQSYTIPSVVSQSPRGDRIMDVYSHLLAERIIYLGTPIDAGVANAIIAQLLYLDSTSADADINVYINCEGGDPSAMLAIYDTMQYVRAQIATTCVGQAVGVGAALLAAGAVGKRMALPHTRVILHQPSNEGRRGTIPDLILQADEAVRIRSDLEEVLSRHSGQTTDRLRKDTDHDRVFTASEAREYGLLDQVIDRR